MSADNESVTFDGQSSEQNASMLLAQARITEPPIEAFAQLAALRGTRIYEVPGLNAEAITMPSDEGLLIKVRTGLPAARRRFTIAHELGHTYFYDTGSSGKTDHRGVSGRLDVREEGWCNNFAGDLLMPAKWLRRNLPLSFDPSIAQLVSLANSYGVALEPLVMQLARYRLWPTPVVFLTPRRPGPVVRRVFTCGVVGTRLRPGSTLPSGSTPAAAAERGALTGGAVENWLELRGRFRSYRLEAAPVHNDVVVLVHVDPSEQTRERLASRAPTCDQQLLFT